MLKYKTASYERTLLIGPDGRQLELHRASGRYILTEENYGFPPIDYVTQRGVFQHGETVHGFSLRPRPVQLVVRWSACSRKEYWANRQTLIDFVRPNRLATLNGLVQQAKIRKYLSGGAVRELSVVPDATPAFGPRDLDKWDEWAFTEALKFIAYDPLWRDPTLLTASHASDALCTAAGSWPALPIIRIDGPITDPIITNVQTGEVIKLTGLALTAGQYATIDLTYGLKTVKRDDASNLIQYLTADSDFGTFHLGTTPEVTAGENHITLAGSGTSGATLVTVTWHNTYVAI